MTKEKIAVIGGGFAGMKLVRMLCKTNYEVTLFDKNNFHQFQPLFYQVASAGLEPDAILFPFRKQFGQMPNVRYCMTEVFNIDKKAKTVQTAEGSFSYDHLVIATGAITNFYGMKDIEEHGIGLKSIRDALDLRSLILQNLEKATFTQDMEEKDALTNFVIVGGGPAGVEMAGALAEFRSHILPKDYKEYPKEIMKVYLIQSGDKVLQTMSEKNSSKALKDLKKLGVDVILNDRVTEYDGHFVKTKLGKTLQARTLIWTAGVKADYPKGIHLDETKQKRRLEVDLFHKVAGENDIYAIGDVSYMSTESYPDGHPGVAQTAIQQAKNLAKNFLRKQKNKELLPFKYKDKGSLATIGRNRAVADLPNMRIKGFWAWVIWSVVHLFAIAGFRNKLIVGMHWVISYFNYERSNRLIIRENRRIKKKTISQHITKTP